MLIYPHIAQILDTGRSFPGREGVFSFRSTLSWPRARAHWSQDLHLVLNGSLGLSGLRRGSLLTGCESQYRAGSDHPRL